MAEEKKTKKAYRKLVRRADGTMGVQFRDVETGALLSSLSGYEVISAGGFADYELPKTDTEDEDDDKKDKDKKGKGKNTKTGRTRLGNNIFTQEDEETNTLEGFLADARRLLDSDRGDDLEKSLNSMDRNPANNYGYIDKNLAMRAASFAPGMFGMLGKAVNTAINMNNVMAVNSARQSLGLPALSVPGMGKGILTGKDKTVAEVTINGQDYTVAIGGVAKGGKTALTPEEARSRAALTGGLQEKGRKSAEAFGKIDAPAQGIIDSPTATTPSSPSLGGDFTSPDFAGTDISGGLFGGLNQGATQTGYASFGGTGTASPAAGSAAASGLQGYSPPSPGFGSRAASELQGYTPSAPAPSSHAPSFGSRAASEMQGYAPPSSPRGMEALAPNGLRGRDMAAIDYNMGPMRSAPPGQDIQGIVQDAVTDVMGPDHSVSITSGTGQYGSDRHRAGAAMDFQVMDPMGQPVTDPQALTDIAQAAMAKGALGWGYGPEYMGLETMHMDVHTPGPRQSNTWGSYGKQYAGLMAEAREYSLMPESYYSENLPDTMTPPSSAPTNVAPTADAMVGQVGVQAPAMGSANLGPAPESLAATRGLTDMQSFVAENGVPVSPAHAAAMGLVERTDEEKAAIGLALAGELSQSQLEGIAAGKPAAMTELANMVTTVENRAATGKFGSIMDALAPSQYNSMMDQNLATTRENFTAYEQAIMGLVDSYYEPQGIKPNNYEFTHYHANYVTPAWSDKMKNTTKMGDHIFGTLAGPYDVTNPYAGLTPQDFGMAGGGVAPTVSAQTTDISRGDTGFGEAFGGGFGAFGGAQGAGGGSQADAGLGDAYGDGRDSFGGFSAGSLGGSASGFGSGYGEPGSGGFGSFGGPSSSGSGPAADSPAGGAQAAGGYGADGDRGGGGGSAPGGGGSGDRGGSDAGGMGGMGGGMGGAGGGSGGAGPGGGGSGGDRGGGGGHTGPDPSSPAGGAEGARS